MQDDRIEPFDGADTEGDVHVYVAGRRGAAWFHQGCWWARFDGETEAGRHQDRAAAIEALRAKAAC